MESLAMVTMKLIQGYAKEDGRIGLDRPGRFPLGFDFLTALEQTSSIKDLTNVGLLIKTTVNGRLTSIAPTVTASLA